MSVNANSEIMSLSQNYQSGTPQGNHNNRYFRSESLESKSLKIPLIRKRLNKIQQNIKQVTDQTLQINKEKRDRNLLSFQSLDQKYKQSRQDSSQREHSQSVFISGIAPQVQHHRINDSLDRYGDLKRQNSEGRYHLLNRMQDDYVDLKAKLKKQHIKLPRVFGSRRGLASGKYVDVSADEVEQSLKKSLIQVNGKRQFHDIHLIKKGRDKVISSLLTIGEYQSGSSLPHYDNIITDVKNTRKEFSQAHQDMKQRILRDREQKKGKMMKNRHLHGNVYFNMLSLSKKQRKNLGQYCNFSANYGIQ